MREIRHMKSINPVTNQLIRDYPAHTSQDIEQIIQNSRLAFQQWVRMPFSKRAQCFFKIAEIIQSKHMEFAKLIVQEVGKPIKEARSEVLKCAKVCDYFATHGEQMLQDRIVETEALKSYVTYQPLGSILAIMPWNFPFWQVFRCGAPTLMAGNSLLLKHAPNVSGCSLALQQLFEEAGFPKYLLQSLIIDEKQVESVIAHPIVKAVSLTGSVRAGMAVAAQAGKAIKKCVLELGGSDPFIVLEDADLEKCVSSAIMARLINTGQSCVASKRFIIVKKHYTRFLELLKERVGVLQIGDPLLEETQIGAMAREDLLQNLERQVHESIEKGAQLIIGGTRLQRPGLFYAPTIIANVKKGMPAYDEELFGPVFALIQVEDNDEAIKVANDSSYGLGASLWTEDVKKSEEFARRIESGMVFVNKPTVSDSRLPFGGTKRSGYGYELGLEGIREFVIAKSVSIN